MLPSMTNTCEKHLLPCANAASYIASYIANWIAALGKLNFYDAVVSVLLSINDVHQIIAIIIRVATVYFIDIFSKFVHVHLYHLICYHDKEYLFYCIVCRGGGYLRHVSMQ